MAFDGKKLTEERIKANKQIMAAIEAGMARYPDMRFHQLLDLLGVIKEHPVHKPCMTNEFYTEPMEIVKRLRNQNYDGT